LHPPCALVLGYVAALADSAPGGAIAGWRPIDHVVVIITW